MTPLKRNLSRLLFLTLVLTLGGAIFGVVYYLKMDRNEDTLNTLLFRELQQVEGTIQRSLEKVQATAKYTLPEEYRDYHSAGEREREREREREMRTYSSNPIPRPRLSPDLRAALASKT